MTPVPGVAGRTALVTGASRGIGRGIALRLAQGGARVVLVGRDSAALALACEEIVHSGGDASMRAADLSHRASLQDLCEVGGDTDILVNNAAAQQRPLPFLEAADDYWSSVLDVNLWAPYVLMRELGRRMAARGHGVIVNISSTAGQRALPYLAHYCSTKAALDMLTRVAAMELGPSGVRCNAIAPGRVLTGHSAAMRPAGSVPDNSDIPVGRAGTHLDIGEMACFLASDAGSFVNGQVIAVDGGSLAGDFAARHRFRSRIEDV